MVFNNTSINRKQRRLGFTLVEVLVAAGIGSVALVGTMDLFSYGARSFAALANYTDLDAQSRDALNTITQEVRQADRLVSGDVDSMTFAFSDPANPTNTWQVSYVYTPSTKTLSRIQGIDRKVLLRECQYLGFNYCQRNPIGGSYDQYPTATPATCKLVQMNWICSRSLMQQAVNTESVQSAKVVIRKQ